MKAKTYKFAVTKTGPGSGAETKFTCLTEALAYIAHVLKQGGSATVFPIA